MSQQTASRPKLKQVLIFCALETCGHHKIPKVSYRPRSKRVRNRMSPFMFCSRRCQRVHWSERRRQEAIAALEPYECAAPGCANTIEPKYGPGTPKRYCGRACQQRVYMLRKRRLPPGQVVDRALELHEAKERHRRARQTALDRRALVAHVIEQHEAEALRLEDKVRAILQHKQQSHGWSRCDDPLHADPDQARAEAQYKLDQAERIRTLADEDTTQIELDHAARVSEARVTEAGHWLDVALNDAETRRLAAQQRKQAAREAVGVA